MGKILYFNHDARQLLAGRCGRAGQHRQGHARPQGTNVVLERLTGSPMITNDGVSIAREIELSNPLQEHGCAAGAARSPTRPAT